MCMKSNDCEFQERVNAVDRLVTNMDDKAEIELSEEWYDMIFEEV